MDHTQDDPQETSYVMVFATSEADVIPVIKSVLRGADIPFQTDGEAMMNLFPSDLLGPVLSRARGEVRFNVPESRADEARELLAEQPQAIELPEGALGDDLVDKETED